MLKAAAVKLFACSIAFLVSVEYSLAACESSCPQGHEKTASAQQPEVNGCGVKGLSFDTNQFPGFTEICNEHDRCYGKCWRSKEQCDQEFSRGMTEYCESQPRHLQQGCKGIASLYATGVVALGCSFYLAGQKNGCKCIRSRST